MQAFPGMTPDRIWDLPHLEFILLAHAAQEWADQQRQAARQQQQRGGR